jgi:hypothetical protein
VSGTNFYTVRTFEGEAIIGTESVEEALHYFREHAPAKILVSVWEGEGEDIYQAIEPINVTSLVVQAQIQQFDRLRGLRL